MGLYSVGDSLYVRAEITEVDPDDSTRYTVTTNLAKFRVKEEKDTLVPDTSADSYTESQINSLIHTILAMPDEQLLVMFGNGFESLDGFFRSGKTIEDMINCYDAWRKTNETIIGDIVWYTPGEGEVDPNTTKGKIKCCVVAIKETPGASEEEQPTTSYVLQDKDSNYYISTRAMIENVGVHIDVAESLNAIDKMIEDAV